MLLTRRDLGSRQLSVLAGGRSAGRKLRSCLRLALELRAADGGCSVPTSDVLARLVLNWRAVGVSLVDARLARLLGATFI